MNTNELKQHRNSQLVRGAQGDFYFADLLFKFGRVVALLRLAPLHVLCAAEVISHK